MRVISSLLVVIFSAAPVLAEPSIHEAVNREASRLAAEQAEPHRGKALWAGVAVAAGGATVAILGATAFRTEKTTSGNTPPSSFAACEALKANPIYADNRCDALKGPNLAMIGAGAAAAAVGVTLVALGSRHANVEVSPIGVRVLGRVKF